MTSPGLRIGLFGGAFDPVHVGHLRVADSFLKCNLIDELHLLPTAYPPHKQDHKSTSFHHRYEMLQIAFSSYDNVVINDLESRLPKPSYTLQTIEYLQEKYPENLYFLCIGEDNLVSFHEWYKYETILQKVTLLVAARPDSDSSSQRQEILEKAIYIDHPEIEISSTDIRNEEKLRESGQAVPGSIIEYIQRHNLYADQIN